MGIIHYLLGKRESHYNRKRYEEMKSIMQSSIDMSNQNFNLMQNFSKHQSKMLEKYSNLEEDYPELSTSITNPTESGQDYTDLLAQVGYEYVSNKFSPKIANIFKDVITQNRGDINLLIDNVVQTQVQSFIQSNKGKSANQMQELFKEQNK